MLQLYDSKFADDHIEKNTLSAFFVMYYQKKNSITTFQTNRYAMMEQFLFQTRAATSLNCGEFWNRVAAPTQLHPKNLKISMEYNVYW